MCFALRPVFDAACMAAVENDPRRQRIGYDLQVAAHARRLEIAFGGGPTEAVAHRGLVKADAFLRRSVEIVVAREAALLRGLDIGQCQRMVVARIRHRQRPARAVQVVGSALVVFRLAEVGQNVLEAPADVAELTPVVKVLSLAADVDQTVDRARSTQNLAARLDHLAAVTTRLRYGLETPVVARVV